MNIPIIIYIFIFLSLFNCCKSEISIPFESKLCKGNENEGNFLNNYYAQYLYTPITVGSKKQKLEVSLKLNRYISYLISSKNSKLKSDYFNEKESDSYKQLDEKEVKSSDDEFFSSFKSRDNFIFGDNLNFKEYIFYLSQDQFFDETGHIGLQMQPHSQNKDFSGNNFIDQLKSKSLINSHNFYFKYEFKNENEFQYKGNLIIGGMPHEVEPSDLFKEDNFIQDYVEVNEFTQRWRLKISSVSYGDKIITESDTAEISTTFGFIEAPIKFLDIYDLWFNKTNCKGQYNGENEVYLYLSCEENVDISQFKDLVFKARNKEMSFTLTYKDLFRKIGNKYIFLILFHEDLNEWKFGHIFLKKYTMVFNGDKKTIGYYYQQNSNKGNKNDSKVSWASWVSWAYIIIILNVIFAILIIGLMVYIFYYKKYKNRKIRPNELEENFDYTSHDSEKEKENKLGV